MATTVSVRAFVDGVLNSVGYFNEADVVAADQEEAEHASAPY
jgi:hypothetical protein